MKRGGVRGGMCHAPANSMQNKYARLSLRSLPCFSLLRCVMAKVIAMHRDPIINYDDSEVSSYKNTSTRKYSNLPLVLSGHDRHLLRARVRVAREDPWPRGLEASWRRAAWKEMVSRETAVVFADEKRGCLFPH
ncbi:hypothetical protein CEXT_234151 [Caerostris extrusa]|uniref:Uncharacterized protein n=1 Tax=Caerostris extrusa TaxID=172846 RepID=A0AAV4X206_CAEEX|nr:hypothetical protein CEXT_234151 [Caerostris extrusa]